MSLKNRRGRDRWRRLTDKLWGLFKRFARLPEEEEVSAEPVDFSAPSVPYYANLAEKFNLARIVLYMVLFAFVVVTVLSSRHLITYENLYYLVRDVSAATLTAQSEADHLSYPISGAETDFALYRGGLTVAGGQEITVLSGSGKLTLSDNVSMSYPCVRSGEQTFLVFSRGEKDFSLYNSFVRLRKEATEFPVYEACMSRDGAFAVLTRSLDYTSEVIFYDSDADKLAAAHIGGYVTSLSISDDGKAVAALSLELKDGAYTTKLTLLRRGTSGITNREVYVEDATALRADFLGDDRLAVIFDDGLRFYRTDGDLISETAFDGVLPKLCALSDSHVAVLGDSKNSLAQKELSVYDKNGRSVYRVTLNEAGNVKELLLDGQTAYVRWGERILRVADKGARLSETTVHRDTLMLLIDEDGELLACTPAYARRLTSSDFTSVS